MSRSHRVSDMTKMFVGLRSFLFLANTNRHRPLTNDPQMKVTVNMKARKEYPRSLSGTNSSLPVVLLELPSLTSGPEVVTWSCTTMSCDISDDFSNMEGRGEEDLAKR